MNLPHPWRKALLNDYTYTINRDRFRELAMDEYERSRCPTIEAENALIKEWATREGFGFSSDEEFIHLSSPMR